MPQRPDLYRTPITEAIQLLRQREDGEIVGFVDADGVEHVSGILRYNTLSDRPSASAFGVGQCQIGGTFYVSDGVSWKKQGQSDNPFRLVIGSDHAYKPNWGMDAQGNLTPTSSGLMQFLLDHGVKPYMAITTGTDVLHRPGGIDGMTWDNVRELQSLGVDIISHSHNHIQRWDRLNCGIFIEYSGANATATVAVSSTEITLTAGADSSTLTRSNYTTINDVLTAISAVNGWAAIIPDANMDGNQPQSKLIPISGTRNCKPAGGNTRYFACGGGMQIYHGNAGSYTRTAETITASVVNNGYLEVHVDGVRKLYTNLATQTFSQLVTAFNAALNADGLYAILADNGYADNNTFRNYMWGDEQAAICITTNGYHISPLNLALHPTVFEAGITQWEMREWQFKQSAADLAAQGIEVSSFAEPGNYFHGWHHQGHMQFDAYRGTSLENLNQEPVFHISSETQDRLPRSYVSTALGYTTESHMVALADAMAESPGKSVCILWHNVDGTGNTDGYNLGALPAAEQTYANANAFLDRVAQHVANGKIQISTLSEAQKTPAKRPNNYLFNAGFKNAATTLPANVTNRLADVPGWNLSVSNTAGATITFDADGGIVLDSQSGQATFTISQTLKLPVGVTFDFGFVISAANISAGTGIKAGIQQKYGYWENINAQYSRGVNSALIETGSDRYSSNTAFTPGAVNARFQSNMPTGQLIGAKMISRVTGPFTITAGVNDKVNLTINSISPTAPLTLTAGSRTAQQIADEINAWVLSDANLSAYPEFSNIAKAENNGRGGSSLIIGGDPRLTFIIFQGTAQATSALVTLMGGSGSTRYFAYAQPAITPNASTYSIRFAITGVLQGSATIKRPWLKQLEI